MKICFLSPSYPKTPDDPRVGFIQPYAEALAKTNEVVVITSTGPKTDTKNKFEIRNGVKIYRFDYFWPRRLQSLTHTDSGGMSESYKDSFFAKLQVPFFILSFSLNAFKHSKDCDVIDAQWLLSGLVALPSKWIHKKPVYCMERDGAIRSFPKWLSRFIIKRMDLVNAWTPYLEEKVKEVMKPNDKFNLIDIKATIDFDRLEKKGDVKGFKSQFNLKDEKIITFVGRLVDMKDPLTFVRSIPVVVKEFKNVKFLMVGDGNLRENVLKEIKSLNVENYIVLTGQRSDIGTVLDCTDIYVATGKINHCFNASIMEPFYKKIPCIITKAGYDEKGYRHLEDVYLSENDHESLAKAILELLRNERLRRKLGDAGPKFLKEKGFYNEDIIMKTNETFQKLIGKNNGNLNTIP